MTPGTSGCRRGVACHRRSVRSRSRCRIGTKVWPPAVARFRRKASNVSFQARACTCAVWVITPSRSNRQARTWSGRPSGPFRSGLTLASGVPPRHQLLPAGSSQAASQLRGLPCRAAGTVGDRDRRSGQRPRLRVLQLPHHRRPRTTGSQGAVSDGQPCGAWRQLKCQAPARKGEEDSYVGPVGRRIVWTGRQLLVSKGERIASRLSEGRRRRRIRRSRRSSRSSQRASTARCAGRDRAPPSTPPSASATGSMPCRRAA